MSSKQMGGSTNTSNTVHGMLCTYLLSIFNFMHMNAFMYIKENGGQQCVNTFTNRKQMFQENLFTLKWWGHRDLKKTVGKVLSIRWIMLARYWTVVSTQENSSITCTVHSHRTQTLQIPRLPSADTPTDPDIFWRRIIFRGWLGPMRPKARGGRPNTAARRPAWLAGGEWPGRCDFVPPAFSVPCRLPWHDLPSYELMEFPVAVM